MTRSSSEAARCVSPTLLQYKKNGRIKSIFGIMGGNIYGSSANVDLCSETGKSLSSKQCDDPGSLDMIQFNLEPL